ncbi:hypothetical protein Tco_1456163 [Tanacetum coccineum]
MPSRLTKGSIYSRSLLLLVLQLVLSLRELPRVFLLCEGLDKRNLSHSIFLCFFLSQSSHRNLLEMVKDCQHGNYIWGGGDSGGGGSVLSRVLKGCRVREGEDTCLTGYCRRFIEGFSTIAKPLTKLTQENVKFEWEEKEELAFQLLKQKLCSAPILALPEGTKFCGLL